MRVVPPVSSPELFCRVDGGGGTQSIQAKLHQHNITLINSLRLASTRRMFLPVRSHGLRCEDGIKSSGPGDLKSGLPPLSVESRLGGQCTSFIQQKNLNFRCLPDIVCFITTDASLSSSFLPSGY